MAEIEIQYLSGQVERRRLSRAAPLSIGSHPSNDIRIMEEGVGVLHCRLSWNGKSFEVMSGASGGVDVNGNLVQHAGLAEGDLLRIGSVDILFHGKGPPAATAPPPAPAEEAEEEESIGLQPVTNDEIPLLKRTGDAAREMGGSSKREAFPAKPEVFPTPVRNEKGAQAARPAKVSARDEGGEEDDDSLADVDVDDWGDAEDGGTKSDEPKQSKIGELKKRLAGRPARPGEQDVARSPLVLSLGGGALALLLAALTVWFIIGRETAQKHYDAAMQQLAEGNDKQAAELFEGFVQTYPRHRYAEDARYGLGQANIRLALAGATPNWSRGLKEVEDFVQQHRDRPGYKSQIEYLQKTAADIAFGAAKTVADSAPRPNAKPAALEQLLEVSRTAGGLMGRLYPPDQQPAELASRLADAHWKAEQAIATREAFLAAVASIEKSVAARRTHEALAARSALLSTHGNFRNDRQIARLLAQTLDVEKSLVVPEDLSRAAIATPPEEIEPRRGQPLSFVRHTRSGTGEASVGRTVFAVAKDCCYGIDTITGEPLWRRVIGLDTPFFPVPVETSVQGVLLFDTNRNELTLLERRNGKTVWRQPLEEPMSGEPLLHEGRAYVATSAGRLYQIVLDTGQVTKRLSFSQPLISPPALVRNETQLVVAGRSSVLYTLSVRPLACLAVSYSGHQSGSVEAPPLTMGSLVLLAENSRLDAGRLRVFDTRADEHALKEIAAANVSGRVRERPVIRGRQLFVTSSPERITAFAVSEDKEQPPLVRIAETRITGAHAGPLFLKAGADERLWMAGSAFRSFRLMTNAIAYDEAERVAPGITTQPLQLVDRHFFIGRRQPYHRAVLFTPVEREQLTSRWRTVFGSAPIALAGSAGQVVCVTETGDVYRVDEAGVKGGGFVMESTSSLPINETTQSELAATKLDEKLIAISAGGPEPKLWLVDVSGRVAREIALPEPLEANPVALDAGVVLPVPGRLTLVAQNGGSPPEDYPAPLEQGRKPKWRHLVRLDGDELLAVNDNGRLARIQFRTSPLAHLAEVDAVGFPQPFDVAPLAAAGRLFAVEADGRLSMSDLSSLEPLSEVRLDAPASNPPWFVEGSLYVESGRKTLRSFGVSDGALREEWSFALDGNSLAGAPLAAGGRLVVAFKNGDVLSLDKAEGKEIRRTSVGQPLALGPQLMGESLVLATIDGSLLHIDAAMSAEVGGRGEP